MALPIVKLQPSKKKFKVFVSYSTKDSKYLNEFIKFFRLILRATPELHIQEDQVYSQPSESRAGQEWEERIHQALNESEYLIFLISANSLISTYCFKKELAKMVQGGKTIFPIILNSCPWEKQPLPDDPENRTLNTFQALPMVNRDKLLPVSEWDDQNNAWDTVVKDLAKDILEYNRSAKDQRGFVPLNNLHETASRPHSGINTLLPYCCNQKDIVTTFEEGISVWPPNTQVNKSLIVFLRGKYDDNITSFSELLCSKYLHEWLNLHAELLLEKKQLCWPFAPRSDESMRDSKKNEGTMLRALSNSLTGNSFNLKTREDLAKNLANLRGVCPIYTTLHKDSKNIAKEVQVLLNLLELSPPDTALKRLVIFIHIEEIEELNKKSDLINAFKIHKYERSHIVGLKPLQEINEQDIRIWFRAYDIEKKCSIKESDLIEKVYRGETPLLRMRPFDDRVSRILRLL